MTDEYYAVSAEESGWTSDSSNEYNKKISRSRRVLSKFNDEQKRTAWQNLRSTAIVVAGVNLIDKTVTKTFSKLQSVINKFTYAPLMEGLGEYTDQLTEFQAIIQNSAQWFDNIGGEDHIRSVTDALDDLNSYADLTIYKFRDMESSFTGFVNAGLTIEDAASMAKGIASWTAFMGKGASEYASAAYMMNQAMLSGKLQNYQWRSLSQFSQIGGMLSQKLFIQAAKSLGKDAPEWDELANPYDEEETNESFRDSLSEGWLTSSVMLKAMDILANFGDKYDEASLKAQGFTDEVINMAKTAFQESQKVRTYSQFTDAVVESIGTGWGQIFRSFFGDTTEATAMWTKLMKQVTGDIDIVVEFVKSQADIFAQKGGRDSIEGILFNIWDIIKNITKAVTKLFGFVLPKADTLGERLAGLAKNIEIFTGFLAGKNGIDVDFGFDISFFDKIISIIKRLFNVLKKLYTNGLLPIINSIKDMITRLGPQIWAFIEKIVGAIENMADEILDSGIFDAVANIFTGTSDAIDSGLEGGGILGFLKALLTNISGAISDIDLGGILGMLKDMIASITGIVDEKGELSILKIVWMAIQMKVGLKSLKSVFKSIADMTKDFNGVDVSFRQIVSSVVGVVVAIAIIASIDTSKLWEATKKAFLIGAILRSLGNGLSKIGDTSYRIWALIPIMIAIAAVIGALVYFIYKIKNGGADLGQLMDILKNIAKVLSSIAWLLAALAPILFIVSVKSIMTEIQARKAKEATDGMGEALKTLFEKGRFQLNLQLGDLVSKRLIGIAAVIASMLGYIKSVGNLILQMAELSKDKEAYWTGVGTFAGIMAILTAMIALIINLSKSKSFEDFRKFSHGRTNAKTVKQMTEKNVPYLWAVSFMILSIGHAIKDIAKSVAIIGKMDPNEIINGASVVAGIAIGLYLMVLAIQKLSDATKTTKFNFNLLSSIIAMEIILGNILGVAALCLWIGTWNTEKIGKGAIVVGSIATALTAIVWALGILTKVMSQNANSAGTIKTVFSLAAVLASFAMVIGSIGIVLAEIVALSAYIGSSDDAYKNVWKAAALLGTILVALVGVYASISLINKTMKSQNDMLQMDMSLGLLAVIVAATALLIGELAVIANGPTGKMFSAAAVLGVVAGTIVGIYAAISKITQTTGSGSFGKIMLSLAAVIVIIGMLSWVISSMATLMVSGDGGRLIGMVGSMVALIGAIAGIAIGLGVLQDATMGIGAAVIWAGIAALAAIVAIIYALSKASANFANGTKALSDGIIDLFNAFKSIELIDFKLFQSNLTKFLGAIEKAIPQVQKLAAAVRGVAGTLIIADGDVSIGAGQVSVPAATATGSSVGIQTGSVNIDAGASQTAVPAQTVTDDQALSGLTQKEETVGEKVSGAVSGFFGGLGKGLGRLFPDLLTSFVQSSKDFEKAFWAPFQLEDESSTSSTIYNIKDIYGNIDVGTMYSSKYSALDSIALGDISKNRAQQAIEALRDEYSAQGGTSTKDDIIAALKDYFGLNAPDSELHVDGNALGGIADIILGKVAE